MPSPALSQLGNFSERFEHIRTLFRDPGFTHLLAWDLQSQNDVHLQLLARPFLKEDRNLDLQWEAMKAIKNDLWFRPQEWLVEGDQGILISWVPPGRNFNQESQTFSDEVYLKWLGEALQDLGHLHQQGLLHLAQNELTWILFQPEDEAGEGSLGLSDLGIIPEVPLGGRVTQPVLFAVAPEILQGETVDERADLYSLACLLLRQRSPHIWQRLDSLTKLIDAHRAGRIVEFVPKTETPLNEILRQMLQPDPKDRPANALALLKQMDPKKEYSISESQMFPWSQERAERRQANLILSTLYSLIREGEAGFAVEWLNTISTKLHSSYEPYLHYLQAIAHRRQRTPELAKEFREKTIASLPEKQDKKLHTLLLLEEARSLSSLKNSQQIQQILDHALSLAKKYPDFDLQAKVFVERAKLFKSLRRDDLALEELHKAQLCTSGLQECLVRGKVLRDLADLFSQNEMVSSALPLAEEALREVEAESGERARRHLEVGLILMKLGEFEKSQSHFYESKYLFSTLKDLSDLVWATAHEIRSFIAQGDFKKARRELKALRARARLLPSCQEILDMVELTLWLETSEGVNSNSQHLLNRVQQGVAGMNQENVFREIAWAPADTYQLLGKVFRKLGREAEAEGFLIKEAELRQKIRDKFTALELFEKYIPPEPPFEAVSEIAPIPTTPRAEESKKDVPLEKHVRGLETEQSRLREENRRLAQQLKDLEKKIEKVQWPLPTVSPIPPAPKKEKIKEGSFLEITEGRLNLGNLAQVREETEKCSIEETLRRNKGNRNQTAQELKIHRRTLFEKIHKYGLEDISFLPSKEEILKTLEECGGKKKPSRATIGDESKLVLSEVAGVGD